MCSLVSEYWFPIGVSLIIPRTRDIVSNLPINYFVVYVDHFKVGLHFSLLPLFLDLLIYFDINLSQLVPNAIRVIVGFKKLWRSKGVVSFLALFRAFFYLKNHPQ